MVSVFRIQWWGQKGKCVSLPLLFRIARQTREPFTDSVTSYGRLARLWTSPHTSSTQASIRANQGTEGLQLPGALWRGEDPNWTNKTPFEFWLTCWPALILIPISPPLCLSVVSRAGPYKSNKWLLIMGCANLLMACYNWYNYIVVCVTQPVCGWQGLLHQWENDLRVGQCKLSFNVR